MGSIEWNDGTNAPKIKVISNNQICLNALDFLAEQQKISGGGFTVTSSSRLNHNGAYLMHFFSKRGMDSVLPMVEAIVSEHDNGAEIRVSCCSDF